MFSATLIGYPLPLYCYLYLLSKLLFLGKMNLKQKETMPPVPRQNKKTAKRKNRNLMSFERKI